MTDNISCGAKIPSGLCQAQPVEGKTRCFRHGGAPGSGAPRGSQNAYKHGRRSKAAIEARKQKSMLKRRVVTLGRIAQLLKELKGCKGKTLIF